MGNVAATIVRTWSDGPVKIVIADLSMSSSYATGRRHGAAVRARARHRSKHST
jgi:hypothetical protein